MDAAMRLGSPVFARRAADEATAPLRAARAEALHLAASLAGHLDAAATASLARKLYAVRSGQLLQQPFVQTYMQAEAYVARHGAGGAHGVRLATLLERHEDLETLRREHPAFAWHVEKDAADEDGDEPCAKAPRAAAPPAASPAPDEDAIDLTGTPASPAREPERAELSLDEYLF
jgi:hypothetical protein